MKPRSLVLLTAIILLAAGGLAHADGKLYKWVDKDGVTHYGSSIPPEYASQQSEQLDSRGNVVKVQEAQKTPEQLAAEQKAQQAVEAQAQAVAAQKARDQVLLDTYTSTDDIARDRDRKLSSIDAQINVYNGAIGGLQTTLADLQERVNELGKKNKPVSPQLQKQIDDSRTQLIANQQQLLQAQKHRQDMAAQFAADMGRYKQLTGAPASATH
ncbi:MAG TPA: DUF4124 domain-containing protein [Gammaproteobacteria bacterium]|nr:DUF4124 domain-containing protein [Gammaproteobacteria bacterium]